MLNDSARIEYAVHSMVSVSNINKTAAAVVQSLSGPVSSKKQMWTEVRMCSQSVQMFVFVLHNLRTETYKAVNARSYAEAESVFGDLRCHHPKPDVPPVFQHPVPESVHLFT